MLDAYQALGNGLGYVPIDVSGGILTESACQLLQDYPTLHIQGLVGTYEQALTQLKPTSLPSRMIFFLGSTLGNLTPQECDRFFCQILEALDVGEYFLLGVDLQKPKQVLEAAYNDAQGVTAQFNLNMLDHLNYRFAANFDNVWRYRDKAKAEVTDFIHNTPLNFPINQNHPLWALIMGMEHNRIHFETSSMLIRQLPIERLKRPDSWQYATFHGKICANKMIQIPGGVVKLGKPKDAPTYGWDSEYGSRNVEVKPFLASQYLITNGEFLKFVEEDGYDNREFWDEESWSWKSDYNIKHPKFWIPSNGSYNYRAMFDEIDLPLDWPVEVNHDEAMAYCRWTGKGVRLMSEAEWTMAAANCEDDQDFNLHIKFNSPTSVGSVETAKSPSGLYDIRGNVWEWLSDDFKPLPGFKPHPLYEDYSAPFFDTQHKIMRGGSWASTGTYASTSCRNWFRRNFYQHAGFRIAQNLEEEK
ncbi:conserved domain protein [Coleofasciculus chthonoplastes PCC 7420]|uniref:Conserved domain protein n=1 Tax=Coleofasciculus chthonoplastes PCC 7420 TaxID=118168 RepID=B4W071_9CYAN|nr:conserved domain protein [Coleofasciculus chthonoplastes PCC 7420]